MNKTKPLIIKIIIPLLIIAVIGVIWLVKTTEKKNNSVQSQDNISQENKVQNSDNTSSDMFALSVSSVDFEKMFEYNIPVIVDYGSDSCVPCQQMAPVLEKMNKGMKDKAFIKFVDVWEYPEAAQNVPVQVIPTQILFDKNGKPYVPSDDLGIDFTMYSDRNTNEHAFTVHQGGLTEEEMKAILKDMGVADID